MNLRSFLLASACVVFSLAGAATAFEQACQTSSNQYDIPTSTSHRWDHDPSAAEIAQAYAEKLEDIVIDNLGSLNCGPCPGTGCVGLVMHNPDPLDVTSETFAVTSYPSGQQYWRTDYTVAAGGKVWLTCSACALPIN